MQDNERIYKIELSKEEYEFLDNLRNELYNKFSRMNEKELIEYFKNLCIEESLNFEKEIKGTVYKVNTYFNEDLKYTILQALFKIFKK